MRKTLADIDPELRSAKEAFEALSIVRVEQARDAYAAQDELTQRAIDRIVAVLRQNAHGTVNAVVNGTVRKIKVSDETLGFNLFWLATQIASDLAFVGIQLANYKFDPVHCASCGSDVKPAKTRRKK